MLLNCDASIGLARNHSRIGLARNHSRLQAKKGAFWGQKAFRAKMRAKTASRKELGDPGGSARNLRAPMISGAWHLLCATFCGRIPEAARDLRRPSSGGWASLVANRRFVDKPRHQANPQTEYQPAVDQFRSFGHVDHVLLGELGFSAARLVR